MCDLRWLVRLQITEGSAGSVPVVVTPGSATGEVVLGLGQMMLRTTLVDGKGSIEIAANALPVGVHQLPITYSGDDLHRSSQGTVTVRVVAPTTTTPPTPPTPTPTPEEPGKIEATMKALNTQGTVGEKIRLRVKVKAGDEVATGWLKVRVKGSDRVYRSKVKDGKAIVMLPAFNRPGIKKVVVRYLGNDAVKRDKMTVKLRIRR